jgi:RNA polymerase sigma factor (sigma-70 family)
MANGQLNSVLQHIRRLAEASEGMAELSDLDLLARFQKQREGCVFEALMRRHGPVVLGVCQRVLQHQQDAEDVFQATFLVLARNPFVIKKGASLGSWLYGVAHRLALKARTGALRRRARERRFMEMAANTSHPEATWLELCPILDEELSQLPEKYRAVLIVCYLEEKTNLQAARILGWAPGSVSKRLSRARELLRARLVGRGVALSAAGLTVLLMENAKAAVPAALLAASGQAVTGVVSANVASLAEGVFHTMFPTKVKALACVFLGLGLLAAGAGLAMNGRGVSDDPAAIGRHDDEKAGDDETPRAELALIPADALGFMRVSVQDLLRSDHGKELFRQLNQSEAKPLEAIEENFGIPVSKMDRVLVIALPFLPSVEPPLVTVVRTTQPYERDAVRKRLVPEGKEATRNGKAYYAALEQRGWAVWFASTHTYVVGKPSFLESYLDAGASGERNARLAPALKLAADKHVVVAGFRVTPDLGQALRSHKIPAQGRFLQPLLEVRSGSAVLDLDGELRLRGRLSLSDEEEASDAAEAVQIGVDVLKQQLAATASDENMKRDALLGRLVREGRIALRSVNVTHDKSQVEVTAHAKAVSLLGALGPAFAVTRIASQRTQVTNNLKQMALAMHNYHDAYGRFPAPALRDKSGKPLLSWRVAILPFVEQDTLYKQFHLDEPWDSSHNKKLLAQMPALYAPTRTTTKEPYTTYDQVITGKGAMFEDRKGPRIADITDGTSNTIMIVEAGQAVPWTKPEDVEYDPEGPLPKLGAEFPEGFLAAFADGSVHLIARSISEPILRALITRNGGEVIHSGDLR